MKQEAALDIFRETNALLEGHFELRSGLHSNEFFQCAHVLQYPWHAEALCAGAVNKLKEQQNINDVIGVISPALGGIIVGHEVARALNVAHIFAEKKDDQLLLRRGFHIEPGASYVVAEDVVTRGGRVQETVDIVTERGGKVAAILVLVDRSAGKATFDAPLYSLVQKAPTVWEPSACPLCQEGSKAEHPGS